MPPRPQPLLDFRDRQQRHADQGDPAPRVGIDRGGAARRRWMSWPRRRPRFARGGRVRDRAGDRGAGAAKLRPRPCAIPPRAHTSNFPSAGRRNSARRCQTWPIRENGRVWCASAMATCAWETSRSSMAGSRRSTVSSSNDNLRWIDVINEVAFTYTDLQDRNRPDLAHRFLNRYLKTTGDYASMRVLRFYVVYRAMVRAAQTGIDTGEIPVCARELACSVLDPDQGGRRRRCLCSAAFVDLLDDATTLAAGRTQVQ